MTLASPPSAAPSSKGIRLVDEPTHIEGRVNGVTIYLKTEFLKRA